jgi:hypothetical protein
MSHQHREPEGLMRFKAPSPAPTDAHPIVPAIPHVDVFTDTVPPWTVPTTPDYSLNPYLETIPPTISPVLGAAA